MYVTWQLNGGTWRFWCSTFHKWCTALWVRAITWKTFFFFLTAIGNVNFINRFLVSFVFSKAFFNESASHLYSFSLSSWSWHKKTKRVYRVSKLLHKFTHTWMKFCSFMLCLYDKRFTKLVSGAVSEYKKNYVLLEIKKNKKQLCRTEFAHIFCNSQ